jgi:hypothetical protein
LFASLSSQRSGRKASGSGKISGDRLRSFWVIEIIVYSGQLAYVAVEKSIIGYIVADLAAYPLWNYVALI